MTYCSVFYSHGINAQEINQPIGEMLVAEGALEPHALERAVEAQATQHLPTIQLPIEDRKLKPIRWGSCSSRQGSHVPKTSSSRSPSRNAAVGGGSERSWSD